MVVDFSRVQIRRNEAALVQGIHRLKYIKLPRRLQRPDQADQRVFLILVVKPHGKGTGYNGRGDCQRGAELERINSYCQGCNYTSSVFKRIVDRRQHQLAPVLAFTYCICFDNLSW